MSLDEKTMAYLTKLNELVDCQGRQITALNEMNEAQSQQIHLLKEYCETLEKTIEERTVKLLKLNNLASLAITNLSTRVERLSNPYCN